MRPQLLFSEDIASLPLDDVLAVFEDVPSTDIPASEWTAGIGGRGSRGAGAAGGVEERGATAGAIRRRVCEQPARFGSAGSCDHRPGDRRAAVRGAEGSEAESSGEDHLTPIGGSPTLAERSDGETRCRSAESLLGGRHGGRVAQQILSLGDSARLFAAAFLELRRSPFQSCDKKL